MPKKEKDVLRITREGERRELAGLNSRLAHHGELYLPVRIVLLLAN